jgi:hypothetical protein
VTRIILVRDDSERSRSDMETMGALYRALRRRHPHVDVQVCDPGNMAWLIPAIVRDARRRGLRGWRVLRELRRGVGHNAVIVDGRVLHWGAVPAVGALMEAIDGEVVRAAADDRPV